MPPMHLMLVLLINLVWAFNFLVVHYVVRDMTPFLANSMRFGMVAILLLPWLRWASGRMRLVLTAAFVLGVVHFGFVFLSMSLADDVSAIAVASQLSVPISAILSVFMLKETVGIYRIMAMATAFVGAVIVGFDPNVIHYLDGFLAGVGAASFFALASVLLRRLQGVKALTVQAWVGVVGCAGSLILSLLLEDGQLATITSASLMTWAAIFYTAAGSSIVGHGGVTYLLARYPVALISPYFLLTPIFAVSMSVFILDEELSWKLVVGGSLTLAGVFVITLRSAKARKAELLAVSAPAGATITVSKDDTPQA